MIFNKIPRGFPAGDLMLSSFSRFFDLSIDRCMVLWYSIYMYDVILYGFGDCVKKEWLFSANRTILPSLQNIV